MLDNRVLLTKPSPGLCQRPVRCTASSEPRRGRRERSSPDGHMTLPVTRPPVPEILAPWKISTQVQVLNYCLQMAAMLEFYSFIILPN